MGSNPTADMLCHSMEGLTARRAEDMFLAAWPLPPGLHVRPPRQTTKRKEADCSCLWPPLPNHGRPQRGGR